MCQHSYGVIILSSCSSEQTECLGIMIHTVLTVFSASFTASYESIRTHLICYSACDSDTSTHKQAAGHHPVRRCGSARSQSQYNN